MKDKIREANDKVKAYLASSEPLYTPVMYRTNIAYHKAGIFYLFDDKEDAAEVMNEFKFKGSVRELTPDIRKGEIAEYLCCGSNFAILSFKRHKYRLTNEDLLAYLGAKDLSSCGSILPALLGRMHKYFYDAEYTQREYGPDTGKKAPDFWLKQLNDKKYDLIKELFEARLCLPAEVKDGKISSFSVFKAAMPNGDHWASVFTDSMALRRYFRKPVPSIVLPGLLNDLAKSFKEGKYDDCLGIIVNPGREEFLIPKKDMLWAAFEAPAQQMRQDAAAKAAEEKKAHERAEANLPDRQTRGFFRGLLPSEDIYAPGKHESKLNSEADISTEGLEFMIKVKDGLGWHNIYFDPRYRRFVTDYFTKGLIDAYSIRYHSRQTYLPDDLIAKIRKMYPKDAEKVEAEIKKKIYLR
ncbi:MAG: SseB family protein [Lachnospiraceae bacterium]|nr:SseB family protein [Lachnospiraceae bacterium]